MNAGEALRAGYLEIKSHKMRSFLSFSAIAFGVAAILYTFASIHHMYRRREKAFQLAGPGRLEIHRNYQMRQRDKRGLSRGLTLSDAEAIRKAVPGLYMVSPTKQAWGEFQYGDFRQDVSVTGITPEWRKRGWVYGLRGRFINEADVADAARVCVLFESGGWSNEKEKPFWARWWKEDDFDALVKRNNLLGRRVRIKDQVFTVIGVLKNPPRDKDPRWFMRRMSDGVLVPLTTLQRYMASSGDAATLDAVEDINVDTGDERTVESAKRRIEALLAVRHRGENDFEVEDFRDMIQNILAEMRKHAIAVLSVGIVAILAGGIGIMNVTLATIFSRIREIGIRRAVGATRSDILLQFVTEAMMLGFLGGVAGTGLGIAGLATLAQEGKEQLQSLQPWHFLATIAISVGAGFVFSLYPAYQASKLDPVEALRYE